MTHEPETVNVDLLREFDLEDARLGYEIAEFERKRARNTYERYLYLATGVPPNDPSRPVFRKQHS